MNYVLLISHKKIVTKHCVRLGNTHFCKLPGYMNSFDSLEPLLDPSWQGSLAAYPKEVWGHGDCFAIC